MPKRKKPTSTELVPTNPGSRDVAHPLVGSGQLVAVDAVFHVPTVHPYADGPWSEEADKIAWTDPMTGYGCIIRRSPRGQHLCGYVSVPPGHALFGRRVGSLGDYLIGVHGGIDYAAACQASEPESVSVCHPSGGITHRRTVPNDFEQVVHKNDQADSPDDAWWFGFSCNQDSDVMPAAIAPHRTDQFRDGLAERTYKTEAFVFHECSRLAMQLKAIELGADPRDADPGPTRISSLGESNGGQHAN